MIRIRLISPSQLEVTGPGLLDWREGLKVRHPDYLFDPRYRRKMWDGYERFGSQILQMPATGGPQEQRLFCSRGLLWRLLRDFRAEVQVGYQRVPHLEYDPAQLEGLRDYQSEALTQLNERRWGRLALATNAGKGAVIAIAAATAARAGRSALILVDEISVFDALKKEIPKWTGQRVGEVVAGRKTIPTGPVIMAMVPTLFRRCVDEHGPWSRWLAGFDMVLLDEADRATSASWQRILQRTKNSHWRCGFSGSFPESFTANELILEETIGPVLQQIKNKELIDRGISARPRVHLYAFLNRVELPPEWNDLGPTQRREWVFSKGIVENRARSEFVASLLEPDVANAIIVNRIDHGLFLEALIPGSVFISGTTKAAKRSQVLKDFQEGQFNVLIASRILDRGSNQLGRAACIIFASGEGSSRQLLQRIGRGLRKADGKDSLILKDILDKDRGENHYFKHLARKRIQLYNRENFEVVIGKAPQNTTAAGQAMDPSASLDRWLEAAQSS